MRIGNRSWTRRQGARVVLLLVIGVIGGLALLLLPSCSREPRDISIEEATALLRQAEAYASAGDVEKLCEMGGAVTLCTSWWRDAGGVGGVPRTPATVVDTFVFATQELEGGQATGGRVLVVEGVDGKGKAYRTDFFVFDAGSHGLVPYLPVYWSGVGMSTFGSDGRATTPPRP